MGADFLQKQARPIKVARDRDRIALAEETLFTRRLEMPVRFELMRLLPGQTAAVNETLQVERSGDRIVVLRSNVVIGEIDRQIASVLEMIDSFGAIGCRVDEVRSSAGVADVEITE